MQGRQLARGSALSSCFAKKEEPDQGTEEPRSRPGVPMRARAPSPIPGSAHRTDHSCGQRFVAGSRRKPLLQMTGGAALVLRPYFTVWTAVHRSPACRRDSLVLGL